MSVMYAVFSALFGTLSVVFAKLLAELLDLLFQVGVGAWRGSELGWAPVPRGGRRAI